MAAALFCLAGGSACAQTWLETFDNPSDYTNDFNFTPGYAAGPTGPCYSIAGVGLNGSDGLGVAGTTGEGPVLTDPERIATYGLIPIQQPADIYDGYGHGGRGGWSWYTGSAARMMSAAYALLGLSMANGQISVADHLFEPKGGLVVESLRVGEKTWRRAGGR